MGIRFFTADLHFGHANIIRYCARPFDDVEEMDRGLVGLWNEVVTDEDTVIVIGDVAMGNVAESLQSVTRCRGAKLLVPGNHDRCWSGAKHPERFVDVYESVGLRVVPHMFTSMLRRRVLINHFPYAEPDATADAFGPYRPVDEGEWLLCGHVHERWRQRGRAINVGVDAWAGRPVSEDQVAELIAAGPADRAALPWARGAPRRS